MITNIHLHPSQQAQLKEAELSKLRDLATKQFPYPLAVSFQNFFQAAKKDDKTLALVVFANDVTTTVFQFLSLILASEYIESSSPRSLRMYQAIENMTYRPGPGKWLAFLREYYHHRKSQGDSPGGFPEMLDFIEKNEINKRAASLTIEENHGDSPSKKLGLLELIVNLRNTFAHSKGYDDKTLPNIFSSLLEIVDLLCLELQFLQDYHLVLQPENQDDVILQGVLLPKQVKGVATGQTLFIARGDHHTQLFPLVINDQPGRTKLQDIFLMESVDNKKVFFAANRITTAKRADKDELAARAVKVLKSIYVEPPVIPADQLSWDQFRSRVIEHSSHALSEYVLNGKYNDHVYVRPESVSELMQSFEASGKRVLFLHDEQGGGKSAFCAHLTDRFIKHDEPNRAVFLLDARLLDELGDEPMLFDRFISEKLGIGGNLEDFFKRCEKKNADASVTIIIDNLNEYYSKGRDQAHLMDRLFDLLDRWKAYSFIQFMAVARYAYFERSIEKYHQAFEDKKIATLTHMPFVDSEGNVRVTTPMPSLTEKELEQIWNNYSTHYTGFSPKTSWAALNEDIKRHCSKPLIMLFLLRHYDNRHIPARLSMDQIKKNYINGILDEESLRDTLFGLVKEMHRKKRPYLLTEDLDDKQLRKIADSSKDPKTMLPHNVNYNKLADMQLIREEKVVKDGLLGKKISVNNEMTLDLINQEYKKFEKRVGLRYNITIVLSLFITFLVMAGVLLFSIYQAIEYHPNYPLAAIEYEGFFDTLSKNTNSALIELTQNNNVYKPVLFISFASIAVLFLLLVVLLSVLIFLLGPLVLIRGDKRVNKAIGQKFEFFEILQFKTISKLITKRFLKMAVYVAIFFLSVLGFIVLTYISLLETYFGLLILWAAAFILTLMVSVSFLYFKACLKEGYAYERYFYLSSSIQLRGLVPFYVISILILLLVIYWSPLFMDIPTSYINQHYSEKFMNDLSTLKQVASENEIDNLIHFFDNNQYIDRIEVVFLNISNGLTTGHVNLYESFLQFEETNKLLIDWTGDVRHFVLNHWYVWLMLTIGGSAALLLVVESPVRLAKRFRHENKTLV